MATRNKTDRFNRYRNEFYPNTIKSNLLQFHSHCHNYYLTLMAIQNEIDVYITKYDAMISSLDDSLILNYEGDPYEFYSSMSILDETIKLKLSLIKTFMDANDCNNMSAKQKVIFGNINELVNRNRCTYLSIFVSSNKQFCLYETDILGYIYYHLFHLTNELAKHSFCNQIIKEISSCNVYILSEIKTLIRIINMDIDEYRERIIVKYNYITRLPSKYITIVPQVIAIIDMLITYINKSITRYRFFYIISRLEQTRNNIRSMLRTVD